MVCVLHRALSPPLLPWTLTQGRREGGSTSRRNENLFTSRLSLAPGEKKTADSIGFRGWWKTCVSNRMIPPLALYCAWSKQHRIGSQSHGTIPRKESLCAVR